MPPRFEADHDFGFEREEVLDAKPPPNPSRDRVFAAIRSFAAKDAAGVWLRVSHALLWLVVERERKQKTPKGETIPIPKRGTFDAVLRKLAPPAGRKRPAEKDPPPEQSER